MMKGLDKYVCLTTVVIQSRFKVSKKKMQQSFWKLVFKLCNILFVWVYGISIFAGYLMQNSFLYKLTVLFQTIHFSTLHSLIVKNISNSSQLV